MLDPGFTDLMIQLSEAAPQRGLYFGECEVIDERGRTLAQPVAQPFSWRELNLEYWTYFDPLCFPGQLFRVDAARSVGGFRASSVYAADWEMWFKLTFAGIRSNQPSHCDLSRASICRPRHRGRRHVGPPLRVCERTAKKTRSLAHVAATFFQI